TQCSNRLHLLGTAYASRMQNPTPIVPDAYYNELAPYVENTAKVFVCPEVRSSLVGNNLKSYGVRVRSVSQVSGWNGTNIIPMEPGNGRCIMYVKASTAIPSGAAAGAYCVAFEDSTDADYDDIILLIEQVPSGTR